ncbi:VWA domain-containing protein, partial [bacterium]|nr:VWA domain-containing protein [bacterium]
KIPNKKTNDIAFDATLRAAAPHQIKRKAADESRIGKKAAKAGFSLRIESQDIREKIREKKIGATVVFVVDSSGSIGANKKMVEVKAAILSLLIDAYQKRDKVGLVAFKGNKAEVLLPPTSNVNLAKKRLDELPTGGKTPLSKGLLAGFKVLQSEMRKDKNSNPFMVIISDGRANVSISKQTDTFMELKQIAGEIKDVKIKSIVIDTETGFIRLGKLRELAEALGAKYYSLEDIKAETLSGIIRHNE